LLAIVRLGAGTKDQSVHRSTVLYSQEQMTIFFLQDERKIRAGTRAPQRANKLRGMR